MHLEVDLIFSDTRVKVLHISLYIEIEILTSTARRQMRGALTSFSSSSRPGLWCWISLVVWPRMELLAERSGRSLREVRSKAWCCEI